MRTVIGACALLTPLAPSAGAQAVTFTVDGEAPGVALGNSVAAVGDVDLDLVPDFVVGVPAATSDHVRLLSGVDGSLIRAWTAPASQDALGVSVDGLGDLDGDTIPDLAATAPPGGYTLILSGGTGAVLAQINLASEIVVGPGDLDGDGTPDLAISSFGSVSAYSGATFQRLWHVSGHSSFGRSMDEVGDVDGDGRADVVVGAWWESSNGPESGTVYLLSGATGAAIRTAPGADEYHWFGETVAGVGDMNGDGVPDFAGQARIEQLFSFDPPYVRIHSGSDTQVLAEVQPSPTLELVQGVLCRAGDVDGDGRPEFLAGGRRWDGGHDLTLFSGYDGRALWHTADGHGRHAIDFLADTDGDGVAEFVLGDGDADTPNGAGSGAAQVRELFCAPPAASYCPATPNSAGPGATLSFHGELSLAANDFVLDSTGAVPDASSLFFYGPVQVMLPFGDGSRCVGPGGVGVFRLNPPLPTSPTGTLSRQLDFTLPPAGGGGAGTIAAGATWHFQHWFRDVPAGLSGFNLSDALSVSFCP